MTEATAPRTVNGNDPYGSGLALRDGDLVFGYNADGLREPLMTGGVANLAQGLGVTVRTPLGADLFNRAFGLDVAGILRGGFTVAMTRQLLRLHLTRAITADDRVLRIEALTFGDEPGGGDRRKTRRWAADVVIVPVTGAPATVRVRADGI